MCVSSRNNLEDKIKHPENNPSPSRQNLSARQIENNLDLAEKRLEWQHCFQNRLFSAFKFIKKFKTDLKFC